MPISQGSIGERIGLVESGRLGGPVLFEWSGTSAMLPLRILVIARSASGQ